MTYGYAAGNPLNLADPLGLAFLGISSQGWATIGLVAGRIALAATGVGLAVDAGVITAASAETIGTIAGVTSFASGAVATATDVVPCAQSFSSVHGTDTEACVGAVLGAASLGYGAPGVFVPRLLTRSTRGVLDAHALLFDSAALNVDAYAYGEEYLEGCES
jgi:hypothetical protein